MTGMPILNDNPRPASDSGLHSAYPPIYQALHLTLHFSSFRRVPHSISFLFTFQSGEGRFDILKVQRTWILDSLEFVYTTHLLILHPVVCDGCESGRK